MSHEGKAANLTFLIGRRLVWPFFFDRLTDCVRHRLLLNVRSRSMVAIN